VIAAQNVNRFKLTFYKPPNFPVNPPIMPMNLVHNVLPDVPDLRDRLYNPTLRPLAPSLNDALFDDSVWKAHIKNQGKTEACTGFALASMVEILVRQEWDRNGKQAPAPKAISPFMLYYYARRYDDIPGEGPLGGSTARGAMKAWFSQGACHDKLWTRRNLNDKPDGTDWIADAFQTPLGAYYRVDHHSVPDLQAAINETGVVYVSAQIHKGWYQPADGKINLSASAQMVGGHAFLMVGYDVNGFWILNSWGKAWGKSGFANLGYADWEANGMDAWVSQLGVRRSVHYVQDLASGLNFDLVRNLDGDKRPAQAILLSGNDSIRAQQINPYIINLGNNGELADTGRYATREADLEALFKIYLPNAASQFGLTSEQPIDIAIYVHGGLTNEDAAAKTAEAWVSGFFSRKIFPIFVMWETGLLETLIDILKDFTANVEAAVAGAGFFDPLTDWWDARLESLASAPGTSEWDEMKKNAMEASANRDSGLNRLYKELMKDAYKAIKPRLRFHLIGHSAGAIFHAYLLEKLLGAGLRVDGIYFMAPACTIELFQKKILPQYDAGNVKAFTQFYLTDKAERQDNCGWIYRRSLLYLVSNAFEHERGKPILGMQRFVDTAGLVNGRPASVEKWDWIMGPTQNNLPLTDRTNSSSHGNFSSDGDTQTAIQLRIADRMK
jgi:hypothetical protein